MKNCRACQKPMPEEARYCPWCGKPQIEETFDCPRCGTENELSAPACTGCGLVFTEGKKAETPDPPRHGTDDLFSTAHTDNLEQEMADRFSLAFERRLREEHAPSLHGDYIDRFYKGDFRQSVDFRIRQLAEQAHHLTDAEARAALAAPAFEELLDYFLIRHCAVLNEAVFPEKILRYQGLAADKLDLGQMVLDYLDFDSEHESVFTDFVTMPANKLRNAAQSFLAPQKGETIFFICDLTAFGTCKDGFTMTRDCLYWKLPFEQKQRVYYKNLEDIRRQEDWITVNGIFFNANKSLNLKLLRLLKKLRELYGKQ